MGTEKDEAASKSGEEVAAAAPPAANVSDEAPAADTAPAVASSGDAAPSVDSVEAEGEGATPEATNGGHDDYWATEDLEVEGGNAFASAREVIRQLHETLSKLKAGKASDAPSEASTVARQMQLQLLSLREAHRAMGRAADAGRTNEVAARRIADAEHAHLETRRYENACMRAAARRCRNFKTPQLQKLRPFLEGSADQDDEDENDDEATEQPKSALAARLEAESTERQRLGANIEGLEQQKSKALEAFREREQLNNDLTARLTIVEQALEPVSDLLELRPRLPSAKSLPAPGVLEKLPVALRLVFSKFDLFDALGEASGITVELEGADSSAASGEPETKRARLEAPSAKVAVVVGIAPSAKKNGADVARLRFAMPNTSVVTVSAEGLASDATLAALWPEDDGCTALASVAEGAAAGKPYGWAQVLAGLREQAVAAAPGLANLERVAASDVITRVRNQLAGTN